MLRLILSLMVGLALSSNLSFAQTKAPTKDPKPQEVPPPSSAPKSQSRSTEIFEKDEDEPEQTKESTLKTLTAKVKVIRDDGEGREVFFTSDKVTGAFYLRRSLKNYGNILKILEESKKPTGSPVSIRYDEDQIIKSVAATNGTGGEKNSNDSWDFGEVPE